MHSQKRCAARGCEKKGPYRRGYCTMHYQRLMRYGSTDTTKTAANGDLLAYLEKIVAAPETQKCIPWPFAARGNGYGTIRYGGTQTGAHRVACLLAHGKPPDETMEAAHLCGKGHTGCINPWHLRWKTATQNMADKIGHGTHTRGERCKTAKLTETDVREIRQLRGAVSGRELARRYGVTASRISQIQLRKAAAWDWLD